MKKTISNFKDFWVNLFSYASPISILFFSLSLTTVAVVGNYQIASRQEEAQFNRAVDELRSKIEARFQIYTSALTATQALYNSSPHITPKTFAKFIGNFNVEEAIPGIQGIGYTQRVSAASLSSHIQKIRKTGPTNYTVWPKGPREEYFSILHLEPLNWRNKRAIGYDMFTEQHRREAMELARDSGTLVSTNKVTLVQETEEDPQPGFLIYAPVYDQSLPLGTILQRRQALRGFVYSPFRAGDLFNQITKELSQSSQLVNFEVYDGWKADHAKQLFKTKVTEPKPSKTEPGLWQYLKDLEVPWFKQHQSATFPIAHAEHVWTVNVVLSKGFSLLSSKVSPFILGFLGINISLLIFSILRSAQNANEAKSRFLSAMSHEIRTPLGIIMGFADLTLELPDLNKDAQKYLHSIKNNGAQLAKLIGNVLDLAKIEASSFEIEYNQVSLPNLINDVLESFAPQAEEKGIELRWNKTSPIPLLISTDPYKIRQVLVNLIGNALKFTKEGEIIVTPQVVASKTKQGPIQVEFTVKDTGIGMRTADQEMLFQPFTQLKTNKSSLVSGTGLGLALSRQIARVLGGDVVLVQSELNRGSTFRFFFPVEKYEGTWRPEQEVPPAAAEKPINKEAPPLKLVNVLLAEDSVDNQLLFSRYLKLAGANVSIANNGLEAIQKALVESPDLILMDIQMPVVGGHEAVQKLRELGYTKSIVALTAYAFNEEKDRMLNAGFNRYLTKPISKSNLIKEIKEELKK